MRRGAQRRGRLLLLLASLAPSARAAGWRDALDHGKLRGFPSYEEANVLLEKWLQEHPDVLRQQHIGGSYEGRPLHAYVLAANASEQEGRPQVLLTSLMHAREPASLTVVLHFIGKLLELHAQGDPQAAGVLGSRELWLVPFVNPDGYVENERLLAAGSASTGTSLVRKNRRPTCDTNVEGGVDLNRNFGVHWRDQFEPCGEEYQGKQPFSEPETQAMKGLIENRSFKAAINFHSFGGMLTHPFNWARNPHLPDEDQAIYSEIAEIFGWEKFGPAIETVGYTTTGESDDWMYGKHGIISMSPEVGPEGGDFWPPSDLIAGINERNFDRIMYVVQKAGFQLSADLSGTSRSTGAPGGASEPQGGASKASLRLRLRNAGLSSSFGEVLGVAVAGLVDPSKVVDTSGDQPAVILSEQGSAKTVHVNLTGRDGSLLAFQARPLARRSRQTFEALVGLGSEPSSVHDLRLCVAEQAADKSPAVCQCADFAERTQGRTSPAPRYVLAADVAAQGADSDEALCEAAVAAALGGGGQAPELQGKSALRSRLADQVDSFVARRQVGQLVLGSLVAGVLVANIFVQAVRRRERGRRAEVGLDLPLREAAE